MSIGSFDLEMLEIIYFVAVLALSGTYFVISKMYVLVPFQSILHTVSPLYADLLRL